MKLLIRNHPVFSVYILIAILCLLTIYITNDRNRYDVLGSNLINSDSLVAEIQCWKEVCAGASILQEPVIKLDSESGLEIISVRYYIKNPSNYEKLIFHSKFKTEKVAHGLLFWQTAHLLVIGIDESGNKLFHEPHFLVKQDGTKDWREFTRIINVANDAKDLLVEIQLSKAKGTVIVSELGLIPVKEKELYKGLQIAIKILWACIILWILVAYIKVSFFNIEKLLIISIVFSIVILGMLSNSLLSNFNAELFTIYSNSILHNSYFPNSADKLGHFIAFTILSIVTFWRCSSVEDYANKLLYICTFAILLEILQLLTDTRNVELTDFFAGMKGVMVVIISKILLNVISHLRKIVLMERISK